MWCESHHVRAAFGRSDVEKVRTVAARSTFPSKKKYKTPKVRTTFWKFKAQHAVVV